MNKQDFIYKVKNYIINSDYNITAENLDSNKIVFVENKLNKTIKIISWYDSVIISCSKDLYNKCYNLLQDKTREEIFELPLIYGQSIYYIPKVEKFIEFEELDGFIYKLYSEDMANIELPEKFKNVGEYDSNGKCISKMLYCAYKNNELIGVASAEEINNEIWEIRIDVDEKYRNNGLGTYLVKILTKKVLDKGIVPIWCAASTNISSQITANKSNYIPLYVCSFGTIYDENYPYQTNI